MPPGDAPSGRPPQFGKVLIPSFGLYVLIHIYANDEVERLVFKRERERISLNEAGHRFGVRVIKDGDPIFGQKVEYYFLTATDVQYLEWTGIFPELLYCVGDYPVALMLIER